MDPSGHFGIFGALLFLGAVSAGVAAGSYVASKISKNKPAGGGGGGVRDSTTHTKKKPSGKENNKKNKSVNQDHSKRNKTTTKNKVQNTNVTKKQPQPCPNGEKILDGLQTILDIIGFIPGIGDICDGINAVISFLRGNFIDAVISVGCIVFTVFADTLLKPLKWAAKSATDLAQKIIKKIPDFASKVKGFIKKIPSKIPSWVMNSKAFKIIQNACDRFVKSINNLFNNYKKEVSKHIARVQITNKLKTHVLDNHYFKKVLQEVKYAPIERIKKIADNKSFFNPKWSKDEVLNATKYAYNYVKNTGKKGHTILKYKGEKITVFVKPNGTVKTVYGEYTYTAKQLMKMAGRK